MLLFENFERTVCRSIFAYVVAKFFSFFLIFSKFVGYSPICSSCLNFRLKMWYCLFYMYCGPSSTVCISFYVHIIFFKLHKLKCVLSILVSHIPQNSNLFDS
jgi:hypothetical protein